MLLAGTFASPNSRFGDIVAEVKLAFVVHTLMEVAALHCALFIAVFVGQPLK